MATRINKIVLQGFKSFNRKVSIPFVKGFNVITGPNASGKSNLIDAICFVLGKISAKSLRAGRLQELIFHGSERKKPAKQAVVSIYFDNSEKAFPFEDREVVITRKVNQKGICTYKLNGKTVTREKILQVLSAARIHPDGHNIVFQGDVARIIEMNPIERRYIIDEISGIAEYNARKEKALRDLNFVEQKLREAELLISERYTLFQKLEKERNAALRYRELNEQLKVLRASFAYKKMQMLEEKLGNISAKIMQKEEFLRKVNERIEKVEEELDKKNEEMRNIAKRLIDFSKVVKSERKIAELRTEILIKKNEIDAMRKEIERINTFIERLQFLESRKAEFLQEMPRAVREVLNQNFDGVYGTISSLIKVPDNLKLAIQIAAGPHLYSIVVENEDVAKRCIEFLKRERIGRATFLPLNKLQPFIFDDYSILNRDGVLGVASKIIRYDTKFMRAIEFVFGNTLIVKDLEKAKEIGIGKVRMVTLDGDLIERSGVMTGGYYSSPLIVRSFEKKELNSYLKQRKMLREKISSLEAEVRELEKKLSELKEKEETKEVLNLEKIRVVSQRELEKLRKRRKNLMERKISIQTALNKLAIEKTRVETEFENAKMEVEEYGDIKYLDESLSEIDRLIKKVEAEIRSLEPVNFKAIEEYEVFKEEFDKYKKRYDEILKEKEAVLKMIEKIDEKRKEVFFSCLEKLSMHFNSIFNSITGGIAELELEDPNDLESGLIIKATPKGKTLLNLDAMSGGEKTITALSFLFAVQKLKPAPFYILDEADAMLDRENTKKIAEMMKKFSKNSQFIAITHNDQTVKYGDVVYGVTMLDGESKIVGLKLPRE